jgi:ABC-2 type transport system permease protein
MTGALIAELMKLVRHRATWGLVWIFPLGVTAVFLLGLAFRYSAATFAHGGFMPPTAASWIASTAAVWKVAGSGPGRFLVGAFTALAFGGEYGWNTWKLIVPHRRRLELIAAKYLVVLGLLLASIGLGAVLSVLFGALGSSLNGAGLPEGIDLGSLLVVQARARSS